VGRAAALDVIEAGTVDGLDVSGAATGVPYPSSWIRG
jgi:hypothetical protein